MNQKATFAAGNFWEVEAKLSSLDGVQETIVGYIGGTVREPTYQEVCNRTTGHAKAVQVTYDPEKISYEQLLTTFWAIYGATSHPESKEINSHHRSAIFYHNEYQRVEAEQSKLLLEKNRIFSHAIATEIVPVTTFWNAEEEHQQYLAKHSIST
jgi:peptide-methionine (S)-S-oxide reductase